jgi:conjugative relaxase-like TrwC/TraI family protein
MLRIIQNTSAAGAKSYYTSASMADYYTEGQELEGIWRGEGAARLGLSGTVQKEAWDALCDNRNPATGKTLTLRRKQERRVGYDFNFHVPKSVSLLYGLTQDKLILEAFRASVDETMRDMESEIKTRVRKGGKNEDRVSGNLIWGEFIHTTARPIKGIPDPHLHAHCFVFNVTFDDEEKRWKAAQFGDIKSDASYFEARFHSRMARRLEELGLPVARTKTGWEIAGISPSTIKKFSRRTNQVEQAAIELRDERVLERLKEEGYSVKKLEDGREIIDQDKLSANEQRKLLRLIEVFSREETLSEKEKSRLGARTRERKQKNLSCDELRRKWRDRLSDDERSGLARLAESVGSGPIPDNMRAAKEAALLATEHCFERNSVVGERELLAQALKRSVGLASLETTEQAVREQNLIVAERDGRRLVTTGAVLEEESRLTDFARRGRGACPKLGKGEHEFREEKLNDGQRRAVLHVLNSPDRVIVIRGAAGVGKTTAMREAVNAIEANGKQVFTFAPSADASRGVLRDQEGFKDADTVARLLVDEKLQERIKGNVLWIDEAGLLGTRAMVQVFDLADKLDARVILSGDRRQHGSVERGAVLRLLETEAGLVPAEIRNIQRQKGAYKRAVLALSDGRVQDGLRELDELGWIREVADADRYKVLARDYVAAVSAGKSALVVSPTHREAEQITDQIRSELRRAGKLGKEQHRVGILTNANLTLALRQEAVNYSPGDVLVFQQNAKGYAKGQRVIVGDASLPLDQASRFQVFHRGYMPLAAGDVLRVTQNGKTADGQHRLNNGATYTIKGFTKSGDIRLTNGWTVSKEFGFLNYGQVVTSYTAQSKTVDRVFIGQSSISDPAASREQFYVSVSRGKEQATIYTDDKQALREAVERTDDRLTATEMVSGRNHRERGVALQRIERQAELPEKAPRGREEILYERG